MAFKINTQAYKLPTTNAPKNPPQAKPTEPTNSIPAQTLQSQRIEQKKHPNQNLLDKYNAQGVFFNTQNALGTQLGIPLSSNQTNQDEGTNALLEYLQGQNTALNTLDDLQKTQLDGQISAELEEQIKESLQGNQNVQDDFLSELLRRIQSGY